MWCFMIIWTVYCIPVVFGRHIPPDPTALKDDAAAVISDIEIKKHEVKGVPSDNNLDGNTDGKFQLNNMFHFEGMKEPLMSQKSTFTLAETQAPSSSTSQTPSSSSSPSSSSTAYQGMTSKPLTVKNTVTKGTTAPPSNPAKPQTDSEVVQTGLPKPTPTSSLISSQTKQPNSLPTTQFVKQPVTDSTVDRSSKTKETTTDFVTTRTTSSSTTTRVSTTKGAHVSVFRKKKAVSSKTSTTSPTTSSTSKPTTTSTTKSKTTTKRALGKSILAKCKQLKILKLPLPLQCKKDKGISSIWS